MSEFKPAASCADPQSEGLLPVHDARQRIQSSLSPVQGFHKVALRSALGQILAEDVTADFDVPPHPNSAMDGYAFHSSDLQDLSFKLRCVGESFAGRPFQGTVQTGECVRIMTGAKMPDGCDIVVMQETIEREADLITIHGQHKTGQNVRAAGEDIQSGQTLLYAGRRLNAADLGLLASMGIGEVRIKRPLRVAFFSTGDELKSIGDTLAEGDIYDSNRYTLFAMLKKLGVDMVDMGVIGDDPQALRAAFKQAADNADAVITSGGVSVGEADYVKDMLAELGEINFWKMAMKPGRPLAFGQLQNKPFFGLPGNPVSVMVTFLQFVRPALLKMAGEDPIQPTLTHTAIAGRRIRKRPGRFEYQRGALTVVDGKLHVTPTGDQGSGILSSMSRADCFILLDDLCDGIAAGDEVQVQPFAGLI